MTFGQKDGAHLTWGKKGPGVGKNCIFHLQNDQFFQFLVRSMQRDVDGTELVL